MASFFPPFTTTTATDCSIHPSIHTHANQFDTIVCGNLFGDILSDEASMLVGSLGKLFFFVRLPLLLESSIVVVGLSTHESIALYFKPRVSVTMGFVMFRS